MFRNMIRSLITKNNSKPVGRWRVNDKDALLRANLANMDSCGDSLCGDPKKFNQVINQHKSSTFEPLKRNE